MYWGIRVERRVRAIRVSSFESAVTGRYQDHWNLRLAGAERPLPVTQAFPPASARSSARASVLTPKFMYRYVR